MTLSIPIPAELEERLAALAAAAGKDLPTYAAELLHDALSRAGVGGVDEDDESTSIGQHLGAILETIWSAQPGTPGKQPTGEEAEVRDILVEKFRRQGLHL